MTSAFEQRFETEIQELEHAVETDAVTARAAWGLQRPRMRIPATGESHNWKKPAIGR